MLSDSGTHNKSAGSGSTMPFWSKEAQHTRFARFMSGTLGRAARVPLMRKPTAGTRDDA